MRILMLNYEFPPIGGGAGQAHLNILRQYAQLDEIQVDVLTCGIGRDIEIEQFSDNIKIVKVGIKKTNLHYWTKPEVISWLWKAGRYHKQLVKSGKYDLAHAFFGFPTGYLPYKTADKLPYLISLRGSDVPGYNVRLGLDYYLLAGLFRKIWSRSSGVVANSQGLADLANKFMPEIEIPVIPNGIDPKRFQPGKPRALGKRIEAITVCRLITRKRIDILINAVKICRDKGIDIRLNIAGHGNLRIDLEALAEHLGIENHVRFLGRVESAEMPDLYKQSDLFVMSSAHEGMSNAMLEAMACGLPIVTTHCEGVDELIHNNGLIATDDSPEAFAQSIFIATEVDEFYQSLKKTAREKALEFSWINTATKYVDLYKKIVEKHKA